MDSDSLGPILCIPHIHSARLITTYVCTPPVRQWPMNQFIQWSFDHSPASCSPHGMHMFVVSSTPREPGAEATDPRGLASLLPADPGARIPRLPSLTTLIYPFSWILGTAIALPALCNRRRDRRYRHEAVVVLRCLSFEYLIYILEGALANNSDRASSKQGFGVHRLNSKSPTHKACEMILDLTLGPHGARGKSCAATAL